MCMSIIHVLVAMDIDLYVRCVIANKIHANVVVKKAVATASSEIFMRDVINLKMRKSYSLFLCKVDERGT